MAGSISDNTQSLEDLLQGTASQILILQDAAVEVRDAPMCTSSRRSPLRKKGTKSGHFLTVLSPEKKEDDSDSLNGKIKLTGKHVAAITSRGDTHTDHSFLKISNFQQLKKSNHMSSSFRHTSSSDIFKHVNPVANSGRPNKESIKAQSERILRCNSDSNDSRSTAKVSLAREKYLMAINPRSPSNDLRSHSGTQSENISQSEPADFRNRMSSCLHLESKSSKLRFPLLKHIHALDSSNTIGTEYSSSISMSDDDVEIIDDAESFLSITPTGESYLSYRSSQSFIGEVHDIIDSSDDDHSINEIYSSNSRQILDPCNMDQIHSDDVNLNERSASSVTLALEFKPPAAIISNKQLTFDSKKFDDVQSSDPVETIDETNQIEEANIQQANMKSTHSSTPHNAFSEKYSNAIDCVEVIEKNDSCSKRNVTMECTLLELDEPYLLTSSTKKINPFSDCTSLTESVSAKSNLTESEKSNTDTTCSDISHENSGSVIQPENSNNDKFRNSLIKNSNMSPLDSMKSRLNRAKALSSKGTSQSIPVDGKYFGQSTLISEKIKQTDTSLETTNLSIDQAKSSLNKTHRAEFKLERTESLPLRTLRNTNERQQSSIEIWAERYGKRQHQNMTKNLQIRKVAPLKETLNAVRTVPVNLFYSARDTGLSLNLYPTVTREELLRMHGKAKGLP